MEQVDRRQENVLCVPQQSQSIEKTLALGLGDGDTRETPELGPWEEPTQSDCGISTC